MFASFIEMNLKPGKIAEAVSMTKTMQADLQAMGMKQMIIVDKGNDNAMLLAIYETAQAQESAAAKAAEVIGRFGVLFESPPARTQVKAPINFNF
jgi:pyruvoyl-dependent arginine decarboxylase (PvlArgDC)